MFLLRRQDEVTSVSRRQVIVNNRDKLYVYFMLTLFFAFVVPHRTVILHPFSFHGTLKPNRKWSVRCISVKANHLCGVDWEGIGYHNNLISHHLKLFTNRHISILLYTLLFLWRDIHELYPLS